jgi:hypothetical protein
VKLINALGPAVAALGIGISAVGHWFWITQSHGPLFRGRLWEMNGAFELYAGIFLIGVGVHALASWFSDPDPSSVRDPR